MQMRLEGKVAAVTGAASGIGLATAEAMLAAGARVVMIDRDERGLAAVCSRLGEGAIPLRIDLLQPEECGALLTGVLESAGQLDIFFANAGCYVGGDLVSSDSAAIDRMLNLNVNAVIKNVHSVLPHMIERGAGDIVVTGSVAGHMPVAWEPAYSASKWAINCFVQTVRRQVIEHGVRVGAVSPGPVSSALLADWPEANLKKALAAGSLIEPADVADAVMYMLTRSRNITIRDMIVLPTAFDM
ncbi:SDR family oxidoreductase [Pseudomonas sp. NPDC089996]|uniref:SDR family oxidoreductase n=1 Tax=Pseudomonas sp. NPDC089996 TaxID=3364474 RepID=UPI0037F99F9E